MRSWIETRTQKALMLVALAACFGCDLPTGPVTGNFRGIYIAGWEASSFRACSHSDYWWMSGEIGPIFDAVPRNPETLQTATAAYVHVRGRRSKRGSYGHLGAFRYELVVSEVLDVSADTLRQCGR
jgi:hypothetical protein